MRNQRLAPITCSSSKTNNTKREEPHLSGAYIRSLVKHLSSSSTARSKDHHHITMGSKSHQEEQQAPQTTPSSLQQQQPHKKQVRRRLHTSRPYQERLLNMAEARREIVTALKIHRASMREAKEQQQHQQLVQQLQHQQEVQVVQDHRVAFSAPNMSSYGSFSDYLHNSYPFEHSTAPSNSGCSYYSSPPLLPYHTPVVAPMVPMVDALDQLLSLPTQPLGLNLTFDGFNGGVAAEDAKNCTATSPFDPPSLVQQPSPASSYSVYSSPPLATMVSQDMASAAAENTSQLLHRVLDEEEMAAIHSAGERHDIEWSDTVNLGTSAWWSRLLESVEGGEDDDGAAAAQQTNTVDAMGMHLSDECYGQDVSFPCMDIGEIEGWDAEWFS
ncbi:unnamed protein product [Triticum turgidum subsp. durum]|uniref:Uncharacterized protein n=1 Tax=Triticum turgidum subsp. durum TaxID=4567 RepID=A0A9R0XNS6_TRITD|nr:unnamed protein product [Triticum turgidum subsp. durum]